jgi:hypothetical protein
MLKAYEVLWEKELPEYVEEEIMKTNEFEHGK